MRRYAGRVTRLIVLALKFSLMAGALPVGAQPAPSETVPRLTGIVIGGGLREAIFTEPDGQGAVVAHVGQLVGSFTVVAIEAGAAELAGPGGDYVVQPSPHLELRSLLAAGALVTPLTAPAYREAVSETDQ